MSTMVFSIDELTQERINTLNSLIKAYSYEQIYLAVRYPSIPLSIVSILHHLIIDIE